LPRTGPLYTLPPGYFATDGTTIQVSQHNPIFEDVAQALTNSLASDGSTPLTGNLQMNANKITGLAAGTNAADAVRFDQVTDLSGLTATVAELNFSDGVTSNIQTQLDGKQPLDATLTALAALDATAGVLVQTGADTFARRTITSADGSVDITNPGGVAGNIDLSVSREMELVETIATTSGTSITTTVPWVAGYDYFLNFEEVEHNAGVSRDLRLALYGATDAAYSSVMNPGPGFNSDGMYGWIKIMEPGFSRNDFLTQANLEAAGTAASSNLVLNATSKGGLVHWATAQVVTGAQVTLNGAGSFNKGAVRVYRRPV
jgi:hypothetical protein